MECELQVKEKQVEETTSISGPSCRAQFDFFSEAPGELSLNTGDVIELLERVDAQWLKGRLRGKEGIFPADFVTILEDVPIRSPEPPKPKPQKSSGNTVTAMFDFDGLEGELTFKVQRDICSRFFQDSDQEGAVAKYRDGWWGERGQICIYVVS